MHHKGIAGFVCIYILYIYGVPCLLTCIKPRAFCVNIEMGTYIIEKFSGIYQSQQAYTQKRQGRYNLPMILTPF